MQKWEYIQLSVDATGYVKYVNGEDVEKGLYTNKWPLTTKTTQRVQEPRLYEYLEKAGKDGWEVCGITTDHNDHKIVLLKRPLE